MINLMINFMVIYKDYQIIKNLNKYLLHNLHKINQLKYKHYQNY